MQKKRNENQFLLILKKWFLSGQKDDARTQNDVNHQSGRTKERERLREDFIMLETHIEHQQAKRLDFYAPIVMI